MPRHDHPNPETDPFRPPVIPTEVCCMHCGGEYESYLIEWRQEQVDGEPIGFWCCPTEGCDGRGFGFDIFPTDPDYRGEDGEPMWIDQDDEEFDDLDEIEIEMEFDAEWDSDDTLDATAPPDAMQHPDAPSAQSPPLTDQSGDEADWDSAWDDEFDPFNRRGKG